MIINLPKGVFIPTGTSTVLFKGIRSHLSSEGKTLDLGCGCGVMGIALYKVGLVAAPLYASDLSQAAIECLEENALKHGCPVIARQGSLFTPWENEKFDYIIDDVSGVAEEIAKISPWFNNVPCNAGVDGTKLVIEVMQKSIMHLNPGGRLFFPIVSLSGVDKILKAARENFFQVELLAHEEWPLPKELYQHLPTLKRLREGGHVQFTEKFGLILCFTDIYVAYNH